jgi:hypothetical protein
MDLWNVGILSQHYTDSQPEDLDPKKLIYVLKWTLHSEFEIHKKMFYTATDEYGDCFSLSVLGLLKFSIRK